jgi:rhodanese-related sulfurtransferase
MNLKVFDSRSFSWKSSLIELLFVSVTASIGVICFDGLSSVSARKANPTNPAAFVGTSVNRAVVHSGEHSLNVALVVSPDCVFCQRSAPFYRTLAAHAQASGTPLYVAVPAVKGAMEYLRASGLDKAHVITWRELGVTVDGTPTMLFIDRAGLVRRSWVGLLGSEGAAEALDLLSNPGRWAENLRQNPERDLITQDRLNANLRNGEPLTIIDIRERDQYEQEHRRGAVNIPLPELFVRTQFELKPGEVQVVDCGGIKPKSCRAAAELLRGLGFNAKLLASAHSGEGMYTPTIGKRLETWFASIRQASI